MSSPSPPSPLCHPHVLQRCAIGILSRQLCMPSALKPRIVYEESVLWRRTRRRRSEGEGEEGGGER
eukprot:13723693-Heterocapsa_arctica.AAC.1